MSRTSMLLLSLVAWALVAGAWLPDKSARGQDRGREEQPRFEAAVRPILKVRCFQCHGEGGKTEGGLDLRLRRFIVAGGDSGPAILPHDPEGSFLLQRIRDGEMPPGDDPGKKVTAEQIVVVERWIAAGAPTVREEPEEITGEMLITEEDRQYWSFRPVRRPLVPEVRAWQRVRTPIDQFILARLEEHGESFSPDADRRVLIRRAYLDLLGLPPSPEEVEAFLADDAPDCFERLVDRLLNSPHYGERWGRHWLDVAGYADSEGYTAEDPERKFAFHYRDYVIRSLNTDKPLDQFVREQLAGDELLEPPYENLTSEQADQLVATGLLRMAPDGTGMAVPDQLATRDQVIADTIEIVSTSLLGLSVGCARCHDHRYDPISQADYYRFRAIFEPAFDFRGWRVPRDRLISLQTDGQRREAEAIEGEAAAIDERKREIEQAAVERHLAELMTEVPEEDRRAVRKAFDTLVRNRTPEQKQLLARYRRFNFNVGALRQFDREAFQRAQELARQAGEIRGRKPVEQFAHALTEVPGRLPPTHIFARGDYRQPSARVEPAELTILADGMQPLPVDDPALPTSGRRLAYARHLTDGRHPLFGRVLVNRVWMHHFGRGLCDTPGDLGTQGSPPSHPELLDWLACELVDRGWSLKQLHRLIMTSTVYRQALKRSDGLARLDPDNRLLGGMNRRRLEAEILRDSVLAVSGQLNRRQFGPPVPVMADSTGQFVLGIENNNAGIPGALIPLNGEEFRRSIYVQVRRSRPLSVLETFDSPTMEPNCLARTASTVAPQSLLLMNSEFIVEQSLAFARRLMGEVGHDPQAQAARAFQLAYCRSADVAELVEAARFIEERLKYFRAHPPIQVVLNEQTTGTGRLLSDEGVDVPLDPEQTAVAVFCQMLLSSNEFLYVD